MVPLSWRLKPEVQAWAGRVLLRPCCMCVDGCALPGSSWGPSFMCVCVLIPSSCKDSILTSFLLQRPYL